MNRSHLLLHLEETYDGGRAAHDSSNMESRGRPSHHPHSKVMEAVKEPCLKGDQNSFQLILHFFNFKNRYHLFSFVTLKDKAHPTSNFSINLSHPFVSLAPPVQIVSSHEQGPPSSHVTLYCNFVFCKALCLLLGLYKHCIVIIIKILASNPNLPSSVTTFFYQMSSAFWIDQLESWCPTSKHGLHAALQQSVFDPLCSNNRYTVGCTWSDSGSGRLQCWNHQLSVTIMVTRRWIQPIDHSTGAQCGWVALYCKSELRLVNQSFKMNGTHLFFCLLFFLFSLLSPHIFTSLSKLQNTPFCLKPTSTN